MKNLLLLFMISTMITSCNSQTDLETLKYDRDISLLLKDVKSTEKIKDAYNSLLSYETEDLQNFKFGDVSFTKYSIPDGYAYGSNSLDIHVDSYDSNNFLGITLNITNKEEAQKLLNYLKKKYGNPENRDTDGNGLAFLWQCDQSKQWIFFFQKKENTRKNNIYLSTRVVVLKQGTRVENSNDPKVFTVLDLFNYMNPKIK